jgi:hypothetical protein
MNCSKLKLINLIVFLLLFESVALCEYHIWLDPDSNVTKKINLDNGEISIKIRSNEFYRIGRVKFHAQFQKSDFLSKEIRHFKDGNLDYFLIKDLNLLYLLDEEHAVLQRFDISAISSDFPLQTIFSDTGYFIMFLVLNILGLVLIFFLVRWLSRFYPAFKPATPKPKHLDDFLNLFLENGTNYTCSTLTLNEVINIEKKSYETQRQLRSKFIRGVNAYLEKKYKVKSPIHRITSSEDKRFVNYQLSKTAFVKLSQTSEHSSM